MQTPTRLNRAIKLAERVDVAIQYLEDLGLVEAVVPNRSPKLLGPNPIVVILGILGVVFIG